MGKKNYAFIHANIFVGTDIGTLIEDSTVLVKDGMIEMVGAKGDAPRDYEVIDLGGRYLLPGMVNLHAHLFGTGKPAKNLGGGSSQKNLVAFVNSPIGRPVIDNMVKKHVRQALASGVTTIRSSGDFAYSDVRVRDLINKGRMAGPRLLVPGPAITCIGGHGDGTFAKTSDDPKVLQSFVEERKAHNVDWIKICVTGGVMDAKVKGEPGIVKMTAEQTKAVCDKAHELGYRVASHTESSQGIKVALENGVDTIEHGSLLDEELVSQFLNRGAAFIVTTSPALPLAKLPSSVTQLNDLCTYNSGVLLEHMIGGAKMALSNGIPVGLGTDESCPLVTPYSMAREIFYFAKYYGVSNSFALFTGTLGNARIAGIDKTTGSIEQGKCADLIILKDNPLKDLKALRHVDMVMAKGLLLKNPKVKHNDQIDDWLDSLEK
ncbi:MAG: amidohydrolase family protein [Sphaerochaetaceae bacterium]